LLARYEAECDDEDDETWIHHFDLEKKRQSMEWHHTTSPRKKKFKAISSASKIMATDFWDCEGMILIDVLPRSQTINSDVDVETPKKRFRRDRPHREVTKVLLHHYKARPHTHTHTHTHTHVCVPERPSRTFSGLSCIIYHSSGSDSFRSAERSLRTTRKSFPK
jgi:hypothetical protein